MLRGNIRVLVRARPDAGGEAGVLAFPMPGALTVTPPDRRIADFEFDAVLGPDSTQVWAGSPYGPQALLADDLHCGGRPHGKMSRQVLHSQPSSASSVLNAT